MTVLIDNTNLKVSVINHFIELCKYYADVKFMVFDVPAKTCIERDKNRERSVGDDAINKMNEDWKITRDSYAFQDLKRVPEWKRPTIEPFMSHEKPNAVIFDIDGTIALMHNRGPYDWDKVDRDRVNEIVVDQINMNKAAGRKILLVSGRDEECREMTTDWLQTYDIHFDELLMRPKGSVTKDSMVKKEIYLNQIEPRYNVLAVFDDRIQVIKKWNQLGLFVFTCNQGLVDFYVYVFLDQRKPGKFIYEELVFNYQPFYIGVGRRYRMTSHFTPSLLKEKSIKNNIINSIKREIGELPIHYRIYENLSQTQVFEIEINFIKQFGKIKDRNGILSNITDGGDGNLGLIHSENFLNTLRKKVYQYDLDGNFIKEWTSLKFATDELNIKSIKQAIKKKGCAGNYQWRYEKEEKLLPIKKHRPTITFDFLMLDKSTEEIIKTFHSFDEIKSELGDKISFGNISSCANDRIPSAYGYKWKMIKYDF